MFKFCVLFLPLLLVPRTSGSPLLYNIARAITSASSASSGSQSNENVADLRKLKQSQFEKAEVAPANDDNTFSFNEDPQTNNGVVPSLIQKKVTKLLRKFAFITMFANSGNNPPSTDIDFNNEKDDFDGEFEPDFDDNNNTGIIYKTNNTESSTINGNQTDLPNEIVLFDENGKIEPTKNGSRKPNRKNGGNKIKRQEHVGNNKFGLYRITPDDIGYFFLELLGSLAGLAIGATSTSNNTRAPIIS